VKVSRRNTTVRSASSNWWGHGSLGMLTAKAFWEPATIFYPTGGQLAARGPHVAATAFSVARGTFRKNHQVWNFLELIAVKVSVQANLNRDLLLILLVQHFFYFYLCSISQP